jgi:hypothetical protein
MVVDTFERGYTVRKFPGGERVMLHRRPAKKIKGARPLRALIADSVTLNNTLLARLTRK